MRSASSRFGLDFYLFTHIQKLLLYPSILVPRHSPLGIELEDSDVYQGLSISAFR